MGAVATVKPPSPSLTNHDVVIAAAPLGGGY
jgi:hypothetical protein